MATTKPATVISNNKPRPYTFNKDSRVISALEKDSASKTDLIKKDAPIKKSKNANRML